MDAARAEHEGVAHSTSDGKVEVPEHQDVDLADGPHQMALQAEGLNPSRRERQRGGRELDGPRAIAVNESDRDAPDANHSRAGKVDAGLAVVVALHRDDGREIPELVQHGGLRQVAGVQHQIDLRQGVEHARWKRWNKLAHVGVGHDADEQGRRAWVETPQSTSLTADRAAVGTTSRTQGAGRTEHATAPLPPSAAARLEGALAQLGELPVLNSTVERALRVADDPESTTVELVVAIEDDEAFAANLLRFANSAANARPINAKTVRQAVTLVGRNAIRRLALEATTYRFLEQAPGNGRASRGEMHVHAMAVSRTAAALAEKSGVPSDTPHLAGLLHDIGKLVLPVAFGEEPVEDIATRHRAGAVRAQEERERFGVDHAAAGALLADRWALPSDIASAIAWHHGGPEGDAVPDEQIACVQLANSIADMLMGAETSLPLTVAALDMLDLTLSDLDDAAEAATEACGATTEGSLAMRVEDLERLAQEDDLTGISNRRHWLAETRAALKAGGAGSLLLCDVDSFKRVNDRFGHRTGDLVLMEVARVLSRHGRAGRIGGDEFAVWVPGKAKVGKKAAEDIVTEVRNNFAHADRPGPSVSVTVGLAWAPEDGSDTNTLMERADQGLYARKLTEG